MSGRRSDEALCAADMTPAEAAAWEAAAGRGLNITRADLRAVLDAARAPVTRIGQHEASAVLRSASGRELSHADWRELILGLLELDMADALAGVAAVTAARVALARGGGGDRTRALPAWLAELALEAGDYAAAAAVLARLIDVEAG